ncbi:MAG: DoxX family protein [Verrucomicrobia bacterium]|nr:DoxX family protein [Verrucomicrobiota bacterium]
MNDPVNWSWRERSQDLGTWLARAVVGGLYVYMGLSKAFQPVEFLKLMRQYGLVETPWVLNLVAATLPWFEVFCGLLLLTGIAVRGAALMSVAMLAPFTVLVWQRALQLQAAGQLPFCAVRFDCGCGAGEVYICAKLAENGLLLMLSLWLVCAPRLRACLWPEPFRR